MVATCDWVDVGNGLKAYYGAPAGAGPHPGILVYIEAFGVNEHFKKLTKRLADEGFATITPDIYGGDTYSYDDMDGAIGKLKTMDDDTVISQTEACLKWLGGRAEADSNRAGVTGFCMGGRFTFLANAELANHFKGAAAFYGGVLDTYLMRQSDLVLMLPTLPFLFIISAFAELQIWHLAVVLGTIGGLGGSVITVKSQALQVKVKPFVDSARITGGSKRRIMFSHILPNVAPLALLFMVFSVTGAIASESVLSFLGLLNIDMSWGIMIYLAQAEGFIFTGLKYWWLILPAGLSVTLLAGGFYLVGRGLDDVFNPRLRRR